MSDLALASERRVDEMLDTEIEARIEVLLSEADTVGPHQRHQLRNLIKFYATKAHPFRSCTRDNMKRFGPGRTEAVCAVLKDIGRGTTKWRGHPEIDVPTAQAVAGAYNESIDDETWVLLEQIVDQCNVTRVLVGLDEPPKLKLEAAAA